MNDDDFTSKVAEALQRADEETLHGSCAQLCLMAVMVRASARALRAAGEVRCDDDADVLECAAEILEARASALAALLEAPERALTIARDQAARLRRRQMHEVRAEPEDAAANGCPCCEAEEP